MLSPVYTFSIQPKKMVRLEVLKILSMDLGWKYTFGTLIGHPGLPGPIITGFYYSFVFYP